jgi:hypothetical protein
MESDKLDTYKIISKSLRYFIFGIAITLFASTVPKHAMTIDEILIIAVYSSLVYGLMDLNCI